MKMIPRQQIVAASPAEVWDVLAEFDRIAAWASNVDHSCCLTSPYAGVGAARRVQVGRTTLIERVEEWSPGLRLRYSIEGLPQRLGPVINEWLLSASADKTVVTLTTTLDIGDRPPQRLIESAVGKKLGAASDELLAGLRIELARRASL